MNEKLTTKQREWIHDEAWAKFEYAEIDGQTRSVITLTQLFEILTAHTEAEDVEIKFLSGIRNHWFEQYKRVLLNGNKDNLTRQDKSLLKAWEETAHTAEDEGKTMEMLVKGLEYITQQEDKDGTC